MREAGTVQRRARRWPIPASADRRRGAGGPDVEVWLVGPARPVAVRVVGKTVDEVGQPRDRIGIRGLIELLQSAFERLVRRRCKTAPAAGVQVGRDPLPLEVVEFTVEKRLQQWTDAHALDAVPYTTDQVEVHGGCLSPLPLCQHGNPP